MSYISGPGLTLEQMQALGSAVQNGLPLSDWSRTRDPYRSTPAPSAENVTGAGGPSTEIGNLRNLLTAQAQQAGAGGMAPFGASPTQNSAPWTGNNIFRNADQGMGLNEGIYGNLLQTLTGQQNDPYGRPIPSSYTPPTALTGPVATYGGYGGGTNPTVPVNGGATPTGGTGGAGGGGVNSPPPAGGSREDQQGGQGGSREASYAGGAQFSNDGSISDLLGALGIGGDFGSFGDTSLASIFGSDTNLLGYNELTPNLATAGALLGVLTGLPLGTLATLGGSYVDQQSAIDAISRLNDPYGTGAYNADVNYFDGLLNNVSFGLLGESYEDQALQDSLSQLQGLTMQDYYDAILGPAGVPQMTQEQVSAELSSPSLNDTFTNSINDQIASLESQLATMDPDTAGYGRIANQIRELEATRDGTTSTAGVLDRLGYGGADSAVENDRNRDQSTGDAASQSGPR